MEKEINIRRGIIFILISSMGFATMGMLVRLSGDIPFTQKAFFRNSIAFIVSFSILLANGIKKEEFLFLAAHAEGSSSHPIAQSICKAYGEKVNLDPEESVAYLIGKFKEKHII